VNKLPNAPLVGFAANVMLLVNGLTAVPLTGNCCGEPVALSVILM
jgi:hypothetical protein